MEAAHHPWPAVGALLLLDGPSRKEGASRWRSSSSALPGKRLGEVLVERGLVTRTQIARALAEQHELPFIELAESDVQIAAAVLLPEDLARRYTALPVSVEPDGALLVAVADPTNVMHSDELRLALGDAAPLRGRRAGRDRGRDRLHPPAGPHARRRDRGRGGHDGGVHDVETGEGDTPAVSQVNKTIQRALSIGASDIHFTPQPRGMIVRGRVDGVVRELAVIPTSQQGAVTSRLKVMGRLDIAERRAPQDGRIAVKSGVQTIDLRMAVLPQVRREGHAPRPEPGLRAGLALGALAGAGRRGDDPQGDRPALRRRTHVRPDRSGKTTTLYAALQELNTPDRTIMTIEDPVEYVSPGIDQIEVNVRAGLTFARGLRAILRSDPDTILVGEIRDEETAQIAIRAAMTGHMVLSTLHTQTAAGSIQRLAEMGSSPACSPPR